MPHYFAIIPAAGHSMRMGQAKLLLPLDGQPLVVHTIRAWQQSRVDHVLAVVRKDDAPLAAAVRSAQAMLIVPDRAPPDMKASVQAALHYIEEQLAPESADAFLVAPADMPRLSPGIINRLIEQHASDTSRMLAPTQAGRRGHPVLFPWPLAAEVHRLAPDEGLDAVVRRHDPLPIA